MATKKKVTGRIKAKTGGKKAVAIKSGRRSASRAASRTAGS